MIFISEVKKENNTKKKNEHGDICFLIIYKFLCKIPFKVIIFFVFVVTLCDNIYSRFKRFFGLIFFYKIDFSLKNKLHAFFAVFFFFFFSFISQ